MANAPVQKLQEIRSAMKQNLLEREDVIDGMLVALVAREMLFVLGTPGTAKSLACETLCESLGGPYFSWLMQKFTTPEEIFGPLSLKGLQNDEHKRITTNKLPEAKIAFIDEIFKGNSAILNTLLPIINERKFFNGGPVKIPLQVLFGASNEIPSAEELAALYDRFPLRYVVEKIRDEDNFKTMLKKSGQSTPIPKMSDAELEQAQAEAAKIPVPDAVIEKLAELRRTINDEDIFVSDRKWMQGLRIAKANAYLNGNAEVMVEDLVILENCLWHQPEQIPQVRSIVRSLCNPELELIQKHRESALEVMAQLKSKKIEPLEAFKKVQESKAAMDDLFEKSNKEAARAAADEIGQLAFQMSQTLFKARK